MKQKLTEIRLHGVLGAAIGKEVWNLAVQNVGEAVRAIEILSKRKLYSFLYENDRRGLRYRVLINGRDFDTDKRLEPDDIDGIRNSELAINIRNLRNIDIVPVIEGATDNSTVAIVLGALLIVIGAVLIITGVGSGLGGYLIVAGLGLVAAGVVNLLSKPPQIEDFREVKQGGRPSYLFSGPQNTVNEGGPVPVGYGRLLVGSQVIAASYEVTHQFADSSALTS